LEVHEQHSREEPQEEHGADEHEQEEENVRGPLVRERTWSHVLLVGVHAHLQMLAPIV
jgi:hypothetical protein